MEISSAKQRDGESLPDKEPHMPRPQGSEEQACRVHLRGRRGLSTEAGRGGWRDRQEQTKEGALRVSTAGRPKHIRRWGSMKSVASVRSL